MRTKYELSGASHIADGRYMEEIPANAIQGEERVARYDDYGLLEVFLPDHLINKRVKFIIIEVDDGI